MISQLLSWSGDCNPRRARPAARAGQARAGITHVDAHAILEFLASDHARARGAVATAALGLLSSGPASGELFRTHLGLLYLLYTACYLGQGDGPPEAQEFDAFLHRAVPDLDDLMMSTARMIQGQLG